MRKEQKPSQPQGESLRREKWRLRARRQHRSITTETDRPFSDLIEEELTPEGKSEEEEAPEKSEVLSM